MPGRAKPKASGTSLATKPRKATTKGKGPSRAGAKAKPGAGEAKPKRIATADGEAAVLAKIAAMPATSHAWAIDRDA